MGSAELAFFQNEGETRFMISSEIRAQISRNFYAERWKIGTSARELGVHPDAVRNAIEAQRLGGGQPLQTSIVEPYIEFILERASPRNLRVWTSAAQTSRMATALSMRLWRFPQVARRMTKYQALTTMRISRGVVKTK